MSSPYGSSSYDPSANPYSSPTQPGDAYGAPRRTRYPTFCRAVFIIDLVLCCARVVLVLLGVVGYFAIQQQDPNNPLFKSMTMELLTGAGIAATGIPANIGMLLRQRWGVVLAYLCAVFTIASFGVGLWQLSIMLDSQVGPGPERIGYIIGGGFTALVRLALVALYLAAVVKFSSWLRQQRAAASV